MNAVNGPKESAQEEGNVGDGWDPNEIWQNRIQRPDSPDQHPHKASDASLDAYEIWRTLIKR
ncbi:MAG: hypothetical protein V3U59_07925 [Gammaproteobacteria bacterium]